MAKKTSTSKKKKNAAAEPEKRNDLVNFVANNILNNITLNQVVTLVQQVSLRDAGTIVDDADEAKLQEITTAFTTAIKEAQAAEQAAQQAEQTDTAEEAEPVPA